MRTAPNLTNRRFYYLVVTKPDPDRYYHWFCKCKCGGVKSIYGYSLLKGLTRSCGCIKGEKHPNNFKDMAGQTINNWTVLRIDERKHKGTYWWCRCKVCGSVKSVFGETLRIGTSKSCGCRDVERLKKGLRRTHGETGSPTYKVWLGMRDRCDNPKAIRFARYGGRGIKYCERWKDYSNFLADMGERPEGYQIERADNDGNYEPNNCSWIPRKQQQRNTSRTRLITFNGETLTLAEWGRKTGIDSRTIQSRLKHKWTIERALKT